MAEQIKDKLNQDLPKSFRLTGIDPHLKKDRSWLVAGAGGESTVLSAVTDLAHIGEKLKIIPAFHTGNRSGGYTEKEIINPWIRDFSGDRLELGFLSLEAILVEGLYWALDASVICGEFQFRNTSPQDQDFSLQLIFDLASAQPSSTLSNQIFEGKNLIQGPAGKHKLVGFLSGGSSPGKGPLPSLANTFTLRSGSSSKIHWIVILADSISAGKKRLDEILKLDWKEELSRRRIKTQDRLRITTPFPEWDFALLYSQIQAEVLR